VPSTTYAHQKVASASAGRVFTQAPLGERGRGGEGVNTLKPQTTQRCPQVSREGAGRRVVLAQYFQRRGVNCKRTTTPSLGPPRPAPDGAGPRLKRTPAAVHPLPQGGEGKSRKARKSQQKCRTSRERQSLSAQQAAEPRRMLHLGDFDATLPASMLLVACPGRVYTAPWLSACTRTRRDVKHACDIQVRVGQPLAGLGNLARTATVGWRPRLLTVRRFAVTTCW